MYELIWFAFGFVSCTLSFLLMIFWSDILNKFKKIKFKNNNLFFKLDMWWWQIKHNIKYKVLKK